MHKYNGALGGAYGLGFLGALVFYIQHAATFTATAQTIKIFWLKSFDF